MRLLRALLPVLIGLLLALWLGGLVHQLLSVMVIFNSGVLPREQAAPTAAKLFYVTERVVIGLGVASVLLTIAWRLFACDGFRKATLWLTLAALLIAAGSTVFISSRIDAMREAGQTQTPEFKRAHGLSNVVYLTQTATLLAALSTFVIALRREQDAPLVPH
jgi:uncharacterized membrane protein